MRTLDASSCWSVFWFWPEMVLSFVCVCILCISLCCYIVTVVVIVILRFLSSSFSISTSTFFSFRLTPWCVYFVAGFVVIVCLCVCVYRKMRRNRCIHYSEWKKKQWTNEIAAQNENLHLSINHSLALSCTHIFIFIVWIFLCSFFHLSMSRIRVGKGSRGLVFNTYNSRCFTLRRTSNFCVVNWHFIYRCRETSWVCCYCVLRQYILFPTNTSTEFRCLLFLAFAIAWMDKMPSTYTHILILYIQKARGRHTFNKLKELAHFPSFVRVCNSCCTACVYSVFLALVTIHTFSKTHDPKYKP